MSLLTNRSEGDHCTYDVHYGYYVDDISESGMIIGIFFISQSSFTYIIQYTNKPMNSNFIVEAGKAHYAT